jgi:signal peptidase I
MARDATAIIAGCAQNLTLRGVQPKAPTMPEPISPALPDAPVEATDPAADQRIDVQAELFEFGKFLLTFALLVLIVRSFLVSSFNIPSESMQPRLLIGDFLIVNKSAYGYTRHSLPFSWPLIPGRVLPRTPERGDVAVFKHPIDNSDYIKRVIGLPGDRIQVVDGVVRINDVPVARREVAPLIIPATPNMIEASFGNPCFRAAFEVEGADGQLMCRFPQFVETLPNGRSYPVLDLLLSEADTTGVYQVPQGHLFLMGDNRDRSYDSRFPAVAGAGIGIVPEDRLVGEALVTIFSTDGSARWYNPLSWFTATRWDRIGEGF